MNNKDFTPLEQKILSKITEERWIELATDLIKTGQPHSGNPLDPDMPGGEEEAIAMMVAGKLETMGMDVKTYSAVPHRPNVVGTIKGTGDGPSLMMNDHLDTYPVVEPEKWDKTNYNPYNATKHGDLLYARGTSDTRGNMASCLLAAQVLIEEGIKFRGDLIYCFCVDEERDGTHGSIYLTKEVGITADYSITAEPTAWGGAVSENSAPGSWGMNLSIANSGHCLVEVVISGEKSHIWRPDISVNPIVEAAKLIPEIEAMAFTHVPTEFMGHTPPCASLVRARSGLEGEMQFSPDTCTLTLAVVGIVPGMTLEGIVSDINALASKCFGGRNDISASARGVPGALFVEATEPSPLDQEPCVSLTKVYGRLMNGAVPNANRKNAFNDTIRLRESGINAVTFGPGEDGWAADNEYISIAKSVKAAQIYALTMIEILEGEVDDS